MERRSSLALERIVLDRLQRSYEDQGYIFWREPASALMPAFLQDMHYRPDAIAVKGDEGVVIELKFSRSAARGDRLADLADRVRAQRGWEFRVLFMDKQPDTLPDLPDTSPSAIQEQVGEARLLWRGGHRRAALLLAWAAFEAAVRAAVRGLDATASSHLMTGSQVIEAAGTYGLVEPGQDRKLDGIMRMRNAIAHGDFNHPIEAGDFATLYNATEKVLSVTELSRAH